MKKWSFVALIGLLLPQVVFAGSAYYSSPGSYTFTVPAYGTLTVQVWGGGGGGFGTISYGAAEDGVAGGPSVFNNQVVAYPGDGGHYQSNGSGGGASGGDVNLQGGSGIYGAICYGGSSPYGGSGGVANWQYLQYGGWGVAPGGGGATNAAGCFGSGGGGGYASRTYGTNALAVGSSVAVVVGHGGAGGGRGTGFYNGGNGAPGAVSITWTDPPPPPAPTNLSAYCSADGRTGYITWTPVSGATGYYIRADDSTNAWSPTCGTYGPNGNGDVCTDAIGGVPPYTFATTPGHSYGVWVHSNGPGGYSSAPSTTFTCASPATGSISVNPGTILQGESATLTWSTNRATGGVYISNVGWVQASGSTQVYPQQTTTYTLTAYGAAGNATASATATVRRSCALDGITLAHGTSRTFYLRESPETGSCGSVAMTRSCTDGALSGSDTYRYASCSCAVSAAYTCAGNSVVRTDTASDCSATSEIMAMCTAPGRCEFGRPACVYPDPSFQSSGALSGHLEARPQVIREGERARVYWNVSDLESCRVWSDNGDSWTDLSSGSAGRLSAPITRRTVFSLHCDAFPGATPDSFDERAVVTIIPSFQEK